ncbi:hypothetical protein BRD00_00150 [Halobacteriales archaeon QS_8_69_26]|nr:MAG: hypothetical protein BRD00_00150 [Halobacteriales archaeon QS_8_69_26]
MKSRKSTLSMEVDILDFVERCRHLSKRALGKHAGGTAPGRLRVARTVVPVRSRDCGEAPSDRPSPRRIGRPDPATLIRAD